MHIPYEWAKQRPQFLAEELATYFEISIGTIESLKKGNLRKEEIPFRHKRSFLLPFHHKFLTVRKANNFLLSKQLSKLIKSSDIIWLTHPKLWPAVKPLLSKGQFLIYDCMDNAIEFPRERKNILLQEEMRSVERDLLQCTDATFFSSRTLMSTLSVRYKIESKNWNVVNNGISDNLLQYYENKTNKKIIVSENKPKKLVYIGTISNWFNFEIVIESLQKYYDLEVHLYGPSEVPIPLMDRFFYHGPVSHNKIFGLLEESDCLIMPFIITPLIESVNPVKLYEYIASGKPVVAPFYNESEPFIEYVYLYKSSDEWRVLIDQLINNNLGPKKTQELSIGFCKINTWKKRAASIMTLISGIS
jgi:glycosyltransferase involved in cell wall biosynthesis